MSRREFFSIAFTHWWSATALDLLQFYGVDVLEPTTAERPWWWLRSCVVGLLDIDSRIASLVREAAKP